MSELKAYNVHMSSNGKFCDMYLKSEADKVIMEKDAEIAEKDKEIAELKEQVHDYAQGLYVLQAMAEKEARHHKYKRCLAMARWCERKRIDAANYRIPRRKWDFYDKWYKRWLELAKKFKEGIQNGMR